MSGGTFHVHGPHDHELEHAAQGAHAGHGDSAKDGFVGRIAVTTAIIAVIGALFAYQGGATQTDAGLFKNNAAIKKTEASNQWNYYQAKSSKQNLAELGADLTTGEKQARLLGEVGRYKKEKAEIKLAAEKLEAEATAWDKQSDAEPHLHHRWAQATTALQIAIALAAIALLTRRRVDFSGACTAWRLMFPRFFSFDRIHRGLALTPGPSPASAGEGAREARG